MYTADINIILGSSQVGLILKAQLVNTVGANVGAEITTGFTEIGLGNYLFHYAAFPDGHRGGIKFYTGTLPTGLKAFTSINPEDIELIASLGAATDPLLSAVPGSYPSGTAGAALGRIGTGTITVESALTPGGDLYLFVSDSYLTVNGTALDWIDTLGNWPTLTGLAVHFYLQSLDITAEVIVATGASKQVRVQLTSAQTATLLAKKSQYAIKIVRPGVSPIVEYETIVEGRAIVKVSP